MITYLSFNDWCGMAYHYAMSYRPYGEVNHIVYHDVARHSNLRENCIATDGTSKAQFLVNQSDILHFVGDEPIWNPWKWPQSNAKLELGNCPKILTVIGSYFRRDKSKPTISSPIYSEEEIKQNTSYRTFATTDLDYDWFDGHYLPLAYDVYSNPITWRKPKNKFIIGHSPTERNKKGTDIIVSAINELSDYVSLDVIENVSYTECIERKQRCHLFIEEIISGSWGYSAIESMSYGIPTISYIDYRYLEKYPSLQDIPIINCGTSKDQIKMAILRMMDSNLEELSYKNRKFVERLHSYQSVGKKLHEMYKMFI